MRVQQLLIGLLLFAIIFFVASKFVVTGIKKGAINEVVTLVIGLTLLLILVEVLRRYFSLKHLNI